MISKQGLSDLAADVRDINYGNSIKELVFNPETGDFEACTRGTSHGSGEIVTEMTEGGFAAEMAAGSPSFRVILDAQDIEALKDGPAIVEGRAYEWEGEDVVHIRTTPLRHSFGKECIRKGFQNEGQPECTEKKLAVELHALLAARGGRNEVPL